MAKTILVVDDEAALTRLLQRVLTHYKYNVEVANSAQDGLNILATGVAIDLILADVNMPHMNGLMFLRHLIADVNYRQIPVIMMSALDHLPDLQQVNPTVPLLRKPFTNKELLEIVKVTVGEP